MKDIVIIGAGGLSKEVLFSIKEINSEKKHWNVLGFIDNYKIGSKINGLPILGDDEWLFQKKEKINVVFGIGDPSLVKKLAELYSLHDFIEFPNIVHPSVTGDWDNILIGRGNIITANTILTTSIKIGNHNYINLATTIGHDVSVGNYNIINPQVKISGGAKIDNEILIGTGSTVLQNKSICSNCIIGAGAVVAKDIDKAGTYIGLPAKFLK